MRKLLFCLAVVSAAAAFAETIAHWTFGEHGLADISGHGHALTATNVEFGETGYATLNGTNAWLETAETLDLTAYGQITVECWMKPESLVGSSTFGPLILHHNTVNSAHALGSFVTYFGKDERSLRSQLQDSNGSWTVTIKQVASGLPYAEGGWHHVALVMDITGNAAWSDKSKLYVDGVRLPGKESAMTATVHKFLNRKLFVGGGCDTYVKGHYFHGQLDDIRVSSGCLTPDQFLKFPTIGKCQSVESPALAFWPFGKDELADTTGNGFTLTPIDGGASFGNGCVKFTGMGGLMYANAFPAHAFSNSGLTYEFFFRTDDDTDELAMLLENSAAYYNGSGRIHVRLNDMRSTLYSVLKTATWTDSGYNTKEAVTVAKGGTDPCANDGEWHHVAAVYDPKGSGADRFRVYLDGSLLASPSIVDDNVPCLDGSCSLFVGARNCRELKFKGEMDDLRVMPCALRPEEFLKTRTVREPLAHWKFDNAETALSDLTGNGHALVNQNGVTFQDGYAYFNGQNANLITAETLDLSKEKQLTVEGLFWFDDTTKLNVLLDTDDTATPGGFVVYGYQNILQSQFRVIAGTWQQYMRQSFNKDAGSWHHVAFVVNLDNRSSTQSQLWMDGNLMAVNSQFSGHSTITALLNTKLSFGGGGAYGRWCWGDPNHRSSFKGRISEAVITAAELGPDTFRLLARPGEPEVVVRPTVKPLEAVALDLADKQDVTVECYAKLDAASAGQVFAFGYGEGVTGTTFALDATNGLVVASALPATGGSNVETAVVPTGADGKAEWHHYALVIDGYAQGSERVRLYVDGVRATVHLANVNWSAAFRAGTLAVGCEALKGRISSLRVSTGVVPPEEFMTERQLPGLKVIVR